MNVLAVGAHPDDIELGCGGALLAHVERRDYVVMLVMTMGGRGPQGEVSRVDEQEDAARRLGVNDLIYGGFNDCEVAEGHAVVDTIQRVIRDFRIDMIYTHSSHDTHQDHRATATATLSAGRFVSRILRYESPSSREFRPELYVDIEPHLANKLHALQSHRSQVEGSRLVDLEALAAQARFRGFQSRVRFAEAFEVERFVWELGTATESKATHIGASNVSDHTNGHVREADPNHVWQPS